MCHSSKKAFNELLVRAQRLLSLRDHSEAELREKLSQMPFRDVLKQKLATKARYQQEKEQRWMAQTGKQLKKITKTPHYLNEIEPPAPYQVDSEALEQVIEYCYQHQWLDDRRFVDAFIQSASRKGYGPQRIRQDLKQKGLESALIDQGLFNCDINWIALALDKATGKFGSPLPTEWAKKSKVQRYLYSRGFFQEDIQAVYHPQD